jgi:hypothetical protein
MLVAVRKIQYATGRYIILLILDTRPGFRGGSKYFGPRPWATDCDSRFSEKLRMRTFSELRSLIKLRIAAEIDDILELTTFGTEASEILAVVQTTVQAPEEMLASRRDLNPCYRRKSPMS